VIGTAPRLSPLGEAFPFRAAKMLRNPVARQDIFATVDFFKNPVAFARIDAIHCASRGISMPTVSEPTTEYLDWQKLRFDQMWRKREILDNTYLRSLFIIGYLPDEAASELNLLKMERK